MNGLVILFAVALAFIAAMFYFIVLYNGLVYLRNQMDKGWANIDVLLKQRHDLVPNLVETVKGYAAHERNTFAAATVARATAVSLLPQGRASAGNLAQAEGVLGGALKSLFALAEAYPNLKANESFLGLQESLVRLENEIAERREFFNNAVYIYNTAIQQLPDVFVARFLNYGPAVYFKAEDGARAPVAVRLDPTSST